MDNRMKPYEYGTPIRKLLIDQFGAAFLGVVMFSISNNTTITLLTSIFASVFYMAIVYTSMWDLGAKDFVRMENKTIAESRFYGLKAGLYAAIPNFVIALLIFLGRAIGGIGDKIYNIFYTVATFWESMFAGIVYSIMPLKEVAGANGQMITQIALNDLSRPHALAYLSVYFVIIIPAIVAAHLGYVAGLRGFRIFPERKKESGK